MKPVKYGDIYDVSFTQKMTLQGGEYLLSMSCTGFEGEELVVYHRLYDVANITPRFPIKTPWVSTTWNPRWRRSLREDSHDGLQL